MAIIKTCEEFQLEKKLRQVEVANNTQLQESKQALSSLSTAWGVVVFPYSYGGNSRCCLKLSQVSAVALLEDLGTSVQHTQSSCLCLHTLDDACILYVCIQSYRAYYDYNHS